MSSSTRHRSPTVERRSPLRRSTGALITLLALGYGVIHPTTAVQADTAIDVVPLHSTVEVSNLPPSSPSPALLPLLPITTKPFRTRDPAALRTWKELLQSVPGVVPQAPGMVDDPSPTVSILAPGPSAPIITRQFEGLANSDNAALTGSMVLPPDDNLGAGPSHIFEMVNIVGRIVDKIGTSLASFSLRGFFQVDSGFSESDPRVIYDATSGRWFATYLQYSFAASSSSIILAVSTTSDPTGTFCRYRIGNPASETFIQDYPMLGLSDDKVVVSYNGFDFPATAFIGAGFYVLNKADLMACAGVRMVRFAPTTSRFTPHPAQSLSSTSNLFMPMHASPGTLTLLTVSGVPGVSSVAVASTSLPIRAWNAPPAASQPGASALLDTGDERVLSVAWRNTSLWLAGGEACTPSGDSMARSCLRLIEVGTDTSTVRQDMTFGGAGVYDSYPATRPDGTGNLHVVFTSSSSSAFAGVWVTGRLATEPANTLGPSAPVRAGGGAQTHPSGRMGDYSGAAVDPSDPSMVWVVGEYIRSTATADWGTFITQLQFPAAPGTPDLVETSVSNPPASVPAGGTFSVTDTVLNQGTATAGASTTRYYLSLDSARSADDTLLTGSRAVPSLAAGASSSGTVTVTIPSSTASGTYFLLACADDSGVVTEGSESNNCRASTTTINVTIAATGVVAAYGFEEGVGTTTSDASGNGNTGVVSNATWTTGRFGSALAFNGSSSRVTAPTVTLGPAFTLMAWVFNPSRSAYETVLTIGSLRDLYLGNGVITFWDGGVDRPFGAAIANGAWQHVALAYDGATLRAYLNGSPQGAAQPASLSTVSGTLQIGAWLSGSGPADFFSGTIDEVRVFNRALPQAEIQSLMNAPVAGPPADTTPPVRQNGQPTGTLPAGTTQTTLGLTTDENATCRYATTAGVPYASMPTTFTTTGGTAHSTSVSGLADGGTYSFYVRCQDSAANANTTDFTITFSVASGSAPGPLAAYSFNQGAGTTAPDASGNGNTATVSGATWTTAGRFGGALAFNGSSSRVIAPTITLGPAFTLMAWVFNPSGSTYETILTIGSLRDLYLGNGVITFWDGGVDRSFGAAIANGIWQHVALVYDGTTLRAYLNGSPQGAAQAASLSTVSSTLQIGAWLSGSTPADFFSGTIDEVRVFNRALTQAEIGNLMNTPVTP